MRTPLRHPHTSKGIALGAATLILAIGGSAPAALAEPLSNPQPGLLSEEDAANALLTLSIDTDGANDGYDRTEFYNSWRVVTAQPGDDEGLLRWYGWDVYAEDASTYQEPDVQAALENATGCDAREITLIRDAVNGDVTYNEDDCEIIDGTWYEDYAARTTTDPSTLDIEHIVALQDSWNTGASEWTASQRLQFSHDPLVIAAVDGGENSSKGARAPRFEFDDEGNPVVDDDGTYVTTSDGYVPENEEAWAAYAVRYISIKSNYDLTLQDEDVRRTLAIMLGVEDGLDEGDEDAGVSDGGGDDGTVEPEEPATEPEEPTAPVEPEDETTSAPAATSSAEETGAPGGQTSAETATESAGAAPTEDSSAGAGEKEAAEVDVDGAQQEDSNVEATDAAPGAASGDERETSGGEAAASDAGGVADAAETEEGGSALVDYLPRTGSSLIGMAVGAVGALLVGFWLTLWGHRRAHSRGSE